ncbi:MAG: NfeD family protein [Planctomycetota bacterium]|jgi:membrane-bound serine protease (ClpP class)
MNMLMIAILLFLAGVVLGIAEIFIPSAGVLVILSIAAFIGSVYCAFEAGTGWGITFVLAAPVVMLVAVVKGFKIFPKTRIGRWMILARPDEQEGARATDAAAFAEPASADGELVGQVGVARTELRPSGSAEIGGKRYNVVSEGEFIREGTRVRVVEVRGNRTVVEEVT